LNNNHSGLESSGVCSYLLLNNGLHTKISISALFIGFPNGEAAHERSLGKTPQSYMDN
jgi:hypothetical protein